MNQAGVDLVKSFEGFHKKPYKCPANVWTIGYGTTFYPENDKRVTEFDPVCNKTQAEFWLRYELCKAEGVVMRNTKVYLNDNQRAALASFVYNLGSGAFMASTLRKRINAGDFDDVPYQLSRWCYARGVKLKGLVRRRQAEAELFNTNEAY